MPTESEAVQDLFERIARCKARAIRLVANGFRSAATRYAHEADLLSGQGAGGHGGRWNPWGLVAIDAALDPVTAVNERHQEFIESGLEAAAIRPRVFVGVDIA